MRNTVEEALEEMQTLVEIIESYRREIPDEAKVFLAELEDLRVSMTEEKKNPVAVIKTLPEIKARLTNARRLAVIALVKRTDAGWSNGKYAEPYLKLPDTEFATAWLNRCPAVGKGSKAMIEWINEGRGIYLRLMIPWGRCKCGQRLYPVRSRSGVWKVFDTCNNCFARANFVPAKTFNLAKDFAE
jgi:hypothetical protein